VAEVRGLLVILHMETILEETAVLAFLLALLEQQLIMQAAAGVVVGRAVVELPQLVV
jgi:hypothetical protein